MSDTKVPVTLTFTSPGAQPPIFVAGEFAEWHPQEMDFTFEDGENKFYKELLVKSGGRFQYKFRIGHGDWWVLNETAPIVDDGIGNRNNLLVAPEHKLEHKPEIKTSDTAKKISQQEEPQIPILVVEKTDDSKSHGDDFGPEATDGQKEAHEKRAKDAKPDVEVILGEDDVEIPSNTAAEVAESAALLDREASPVPVSDAEAGRTGERRLSLTPIPEVARIASEVADSAAELDRDTIKEETDRSVHELSMPKPIESKHWHFDDDLEEGAITPDEERVPLFPHECPDVFAVEETEPPTPIHGPSRKMSAYEQDPIIDHDDPSLEHFPTDREAILTRIRTSSMSSLSRSPLEEEIRDPRFSPGSRSSSRAHAPQTPNLTMISEEKNEPEEFKLPTSIHDAEVNGMEGAEARSHKLNTLDSGISLDKLKLEEPKLNEPRETVEDTLSRDGGVAKTSPLPKPVELLSPLSALSQHVQKSTPQEGQTESQPDSGTSGTNTPLAAAAELLSPVAAFPKTVKEFANKAISADGGESKLDDDEGPAVTDTANASGASVPNGSDSSVLKARTSQSQATISERPTTPIAITAKKNTDHGNFFKAIWRTVIVNWIGGFLTRLCGGRRQA